MDFRSQVDGTDSRSSEAFRVNISNSSCRGAACLRQYILYAYVYCSTVHIPQRTIDESVTICQMN